MDKDKKRGIGDNLKADTEDKYKSLYESVIAMALEPRINIEMFLKDWIDRARTATRLADKFEALQRCEEIRQCVDDRLEVLEYFRKCKSDGIKPLEYKWKSLLQSWGQNIHNQFKEDLQHCEVTEEQLDANLEDAMKKDPDSYYLQKVKDETY